MTNLRKMKELFPGRRPVLADEGYRGPLSRKPYFEGWYLRQVTADQSRSLAVIVGLSLFPDPHSFIQLVSGPSGRVFKKRYPLESLCARRDRFEVSLDGNRFSTEAMELHLEGPEGRLDGRLEFENRVPLPGIMGPFTFVPFMECIHGTLSVDHGIRGVLQWDGVPVDFQGGRGYIEKDRGQSMPSSWIWAQSNQFQTPGDSLMLSIARIPWLGRSFTGHLGFLRYDGNLYRFATYTGSRVSGELNDRTLTLCFRDRHFSLELRLSGMDSGASLDAPLNGSMTREILESPGAQVEARLFNSSSDLVWEGVSATVSAEIVGDTYSLLSKPSSLRV